MKKFLLCTTLALVTATAVATATGCLNFNFNQGKLSVSLYKPEVPTFFKKSTVPQEPLDVKSEHKMIEEHPLNKNWKKSKASIVKFIEKTENFIANQPWYVYALTAAIPFWIIGFIVARKDLKSEYINTKEWEKAEISNKSGSVMQFFATILLAPMWITSYLLYMTVAYSCKGIWSLLTAGVLEKPHPKLDYNPHKSKYH